MKKRFFPIKEESPFIRESAVSSKMEMTTPTPPCAAFKGASVQATAARPFIIQEAKKYPAAIQNAAGSMASVAARKRFSFPFRRRKKSPPARAPSSPLMRKVGSIQWA